MNPPKSIRDLRKIPVRILRQVIANHKTRTPSFWMPTPRSRAGCHNWLTDGWGQVWPEYLPYFQELETQDAN